LPQGKQKFIPTWIFTVSILNPTDSGETVQNLLCSCLLA